MSNIATQDRLGPRARSHRHAHLRRLALLGCAITVLACDPAADDDGAQPTVGATSSALTGAYELTLALRSTDGLGHGSVRVLDEDTGESLGTCHADCVVAVPRNHRARLVADAAPGSEHAGWINVCWGRPADACIVTMSWHLGAGASFRALPPPPSTTFDLGIAVRGADGVGEGVVRVHDATGATLGECLGARCVVPVPKNEPVRLVATPRRGSSFSQWRGVCYQIGREDCWVTLSWHLDVAVEFAADPRRAETPEERYARELAEARAYLEPERERESLLALRAPYADLVTRDGEDDPNPRLAIRTRDGRDRSVVVNGRGPAEIDAARALRQARDPARQAKVYRDLYAEVVAVDAGIVGRFPAPDQVGRDPGALRQAINALSRFVVDEIGPASAPPFLLAKERACLEGDPGGEVGAGDGLDLSLLTPMQAASCTLSPDGLFLAYDDFDRDSLSCIKDQGARGTCTSFAVVSAAEAALQQRFGPRHNLSEQHLYAIMSGYNSTFHEGTSISDFLDNLATYYGFYIVSESVWDYNQSLSRWRISSDEYFAIPTYPKFWFVDSCLGYDGDMCSDNVAQGEVTCTDPEDLWSCSIAIPEMTGPRYRLSYEPYQLADADDPDETIIRARAKLILRHQLVVGMSLPPSFANPTADGFVIPLGDDPAKSAGNHAMHIVGAITNHQLEQLLPDAPLGPGGGYFLVRNSWGPCFADGGYVYVPFAVMKSRVFTLRGFTRWFMDVLPP